MKKYNVSNDDESTDILEPLRNWVIAYGIKINAVDSLLKLLRQNGHPNIQCSPCTLFRTQREVDLRKVSNISYIHFGLELIYHTMQNFNQTYIQVINNSISKLFY